MPHWIRAAAFALALGTSLAACAGTSSGADTSSGGDTTATAEVDGARAHELVASGATLLDVRTPEEFAAGHIDGAVNVPVDEVGSRLSGIPHDEPVVVYCHSGRRAARAAQTLSQNGYQVYNLGPMSAW